MQKGQGIRAGCGQAYEAGTRDSWGEISHNGREFKSAVTGQVTSYSGADYWWARKQLPNKLDSASDIRWDTYRTPSYYHLKREAVQAPEIIEKQQENIPQETLDTEQTIPHNKQQEEKESIFLTLKDGNVFKQIYIKYMKWKEK